MQGVLVSPVFLSVISVPLWWTKMADGPPPNALGGGKRMVDGLLKF